MVENWSAFLVWAGANKDDIATLSALFAILGSLIAVVGFGFAWWQLRDTKKALQSGNTYEIQKEAREIISRLHSDEGFNAYMFGAKDAVEPDAKIVRGAQNQIGLVFHFYLSVYRQARAHGVTKTLISSMGKDFKQFFSNDKVKTYYDMRKKAGAYDQEYDSMVYYWFRKAD